MKAFITDAHALAAITPAALSAYVRSEGWSRADKYGQHSDVYVKGGAVELVLPGTDAIGDYVAVVSTILSVLAKQEGRDELQIFRDLIEADRDVVRVHAPEARDDGSIAIDHGVELVVQARDMLMAAACSAVDPRPTYRAGKIKEASSYMDRVRLGQTEHGSFIVTLLAPVPPALESPQQLGLWPTVREEPFERLVTRTLANGLSAARTAAEQAVRGGGLQPFQRAVREGVSANLCESLASLIERVRALQVSVTWAKTRPAPEPRRRVEFSPAEGEVFREAARLFRSMEPRPDERLEAVVIALDRKEDELEGRVRMKTFIDGKPVSVRTTLPYQLYTIAVNAHDNKEAIGITGDLKRHGQRWILENPRDLVVIPEDDDASPT